MLAIHNKNQARQHARAVANAYAKLSKCQQFTTRGILVFQSLMLQTLMQSYQNVSNSQPLYSIIYDQARCKRLCKVIKMLAIHNYSPFAIFTLLVANAFAKLSKCQQFTTVQFSSNFCRSLQTLLQSYQNVSNSQLWR